MGGSRLLPEDATGEKRLALCLRSFARLCQGSDFMHHIRYRDVRKAARQGIFAMMPVAAGSAQRATADDVGTLAVGTGAVGIRRADERHDRTPQRCGQMRRSGVPADVHGTDECADCRGATAVLSDAVRA